MTGASTRTGDQSVAVEGRAVGVASFDGNASRMCVSWMFANQEWNESDLPEMYDQLMMHTAQGHLAWVVFPRYGYRFDGFARVDARFVMG